MAQATKMGADTATLEKRRKALTGHKCLKCSQEVSFGDLLMVKVIQMEEGRPRSHQVIYHRKCYTICSPPCDKVKHRGVSTGALLL
jgi:hypothetical protein